MKQFCKLYKNYFHELSLCVKKVQKHKIKEVLMKHLLPKIFYRSYESKLTCIKVNHFMHNFEKSSNIL